MMAAKPVHEVGAMSIAAGRLAEDRFSERLCIEPYLQLYETLGPARGKRGRDV